MPIRRPLLVLSFILVLFTACAPRPPVTVSVPHAGGKAGPPNLYPDPAKTPGALDAAVTQDNIHQTICVKGYTDTVRPPTSYTNRVKTQSLADYGFSGPPSQYELDHFIPLELGGCARCVSNLWPESWGDASELGAHAKDKVENYLHRQVCSDAMSLAEAQREIRDDWYAVYLRIQR